MRSPRVLIIHNLPILPADHPDVESEVLILEAVDWVKEVLAKAGFGVSCLAVGSEPGPLLTALRRQRPDVVFNLFEGSAEDGSDEAYLAGLLEWLRIPFTGSPSQTLCLARNKPLAKRLFRGAGLPTADFFAVEKLPTPECSVPFPVIVKPGLQDASVGLDQGSVVTRQNQLERRVATLMENYGPPILVEEFIPGREFIVGVAGHPQPRALPVGEIVFQCKDRGYWPIVTYDAKWRPESRDYQATPPQYPANIGRGLARRLSELALRAYHLFGCRDYARIDFRVRPNGKPYLLEVNPNPDYSPDAGFAGGLKAAAINHAQYTAEIVSAALERGGRRSAVPALEFSLCPKDQKTREAASNPRPTR